MKLKRLRAFFKKGGGEVLAFLMCLPVMMFVLFLILDVIRMGAVREKLEYAAYMAARAAVVEDNLGKAKTAANKKAKEILDPDKSGLQIDKTYGKWLSNKFVTISYASKNGLESQAKSGTKKDSSAKRDKWEKGNFILVDVGVRMKAFTTPTGYSTKHASIVMMIEELNEEDSLYPWFKDV